MGKKPVKTPADVLEAAKVAAHDPLCIAMLTAPPFQPVFDVVRNTAGVGGMAGMGGLAGTGRLQTIWYIYSPWLFTQ
jgi:hypothetical protein